MLGGNKLFGGMVKMFMAYKENIAGIIRDAISYRIVIRINQDPLSVGCGYPETGMPQPFNCNWHLKLLSGMYGDFTTG
jgi:hypothetical protein